MRTIHVDGEPFELADAKPEQPADALPCPTLADVEAAIAGGRRVIIQFEMRSRFLNPGLCGAIEEGGHPLGWHTLDVIATGNGVVKAHANLGPHFGQGGTILILPAAFADPIDGYSLQEPTPDALAQPTDH